MKVVALPSLFFASMSRAILLAQVRWTSFARYFTSLLRADHAQLEKFHAIHGHKYQSTGEEVQWTKDELKSYFNYMFTAPRSSRTLLFVDGLDQCSGHSMRELALFFRETTEASSSVDAGLSICLSSRDYPKVSVANCPEVMLDKLNTEDIRHFVHKRFTTAGVGEGAEWMKLEAHIVESVVHDPSVLYYATEQGLLSWVNYLIASGLNVNQRGGDYRYPLLAAANQAHAEIMIFLLDHGAQPIVRDYQGRSVLHHIVLSGQVKLLPSLPTDIVRLLIEAEDKSGQTPLHLSVQTGHIALTEQILEFGASPNRQDSWRRTALHHACEVEQPNVAVIQMLLAHGARTNTECRRGFVPSQAAFGTGYLEGVCLLDTHYPPTLDRSLDSRRAVTVRVQNTSVLNMLVKPYVLVSFSGEAKVLYPAEDGHGASPEWNHVRFFFRVAQNRNNEARFCFV
ncbi:ankyrin repeat-containing domain protein [Aspergillus filifer]